MIHIYKKNTTIIRFNDESMEYEAIKIFGDFTSYLKNIIPLNDKELVISGFSERGDALSNEEEFTSMKTNALQKLNT